MYKPKYVYFILFEINIFDNVVLGSGVQYSDL
jgi:hypothetical protein